MASWRSSVVYRTDNCVQFVKYIAKWCHDLDTASDEDRDSIRLKLGLESGAPIDIRNNVLSTLVSILNNASPSKPPHHSASVKEPPHCTDSTMKKELVATSSSRDRVGLLLDFNLSSYLDTWPAFVIQLSDLLLHDICKDTPKKSVVNVFRKLLRKLLSEKPTVIHCQTDLEKFFKQQFMSNGLLLRQSTILWHGQATSEESTSNINLFLKGHKKIALLKDVFSSSWQYSDEGLSMFMPRVYARTKEGWQCSVYNTDWKTVENAEFPDWILSDTSIGVDKKKILIDFLYSGMEFQSQGHILAENIVYFFVAKGVKIDEGSVEVGNDNNKLSEIQLYAGESKLNIEKRWMGGGNTYCRVAKKLVFDKILRENKNFKEFAEKVRADKARLVEIYLALASLQQCQLALFILHVIENEKERKAKETNLIEQLDLVNMRFGLNGTKGNKGSGGSKGEATQTAPPSLELFQP